MLFWPLVVLSVVVVALVAAGGPADGVPGVDGAWPPMAFIVVFATGLILAAAGRMLLGGGARAARRVVLCFGIAAAVLAGYAGRHELAGGWERLRGSLHPAVALATADGSAELRRAWDGHYRAEAEVNGIPVMLMVDTGASIVLLPYEEVGALGIDPDALDFSMPIRTANGTSAVAPVRLSSIKIGPIAVFDVEAAVAQPGVLDMALLGMSFLERLSETSFRGDRLILRN
jgi:aspartyl protease family protein